MNPMKKCLSILMIAALIIGCKKDDDNDPNITIIYGTELIQTVYANSTTARGIGFTTTGAWTSLVDSNWVSITPESGTAGDNIVEISLSENTTGTNRTATVTITCNGEHITVIITQKGENKAVDDSL